MEQEKGFTFRFRDEEMNFIKVYEEMRDEILKGMTIATVDFFSHSIINSACNIDDAFSKMIQDENLLCAIPFIRMQLDNALMTWAFLICKDELKFFNTILEGKEVNQQKVNWNNLRYYNITQEIATEKGINFKPKEQLLTNRFLYETLNLVHDGTTDLYKKCCTYVHPSASILKASLFTPNEGEIKIKGWEDTKPFGYTIEEVVADYIKANVILTKVLDEVRKLKEHNVMLYLRIQNNEELPEGSMKGYIPPTMEEIKKMLELLRHKAEN